MKNRLFKVKSVGCKKWINLKMEIKSEKKYKYLQIAKL